MATYLLEELIGDTSFPYPDSNGINATNAVVGGCSSSDGSDYVAYVCRTPGSPVVVSPTGSVRSVLSAINDDGVAVGSWRDAKDVSHAFSLSPADKITTLDSLLGSSWSVASDINAKGAIVGAADFGTTADARAAHAFLYDPAAPKAVRDLGVLPGYSCSFASAVNADGIVVGACWKADFSASRPFLHDGTKLHPIGKSGIAVDINDLGHVVGAEYLGISSGVGGSGPFIWSGGARHPLPVNGIPYAIDDHNQVVGEAYWPTTASFGAFLYESGVATNLDSKLPVDSGMRLVQCRDISDTGNIVTGAFKEGSWFPAYVVALEPTLNINEIRFIIPWLEMFAYPLATDAPGIVRLTEHFRPHPGELLDARQQEHVVVELQRVLEGLVHDPRKVRAALSQIEEIVLTPAG